MKLCDKLPDGVSVNGKWYKLDFDFRNVLRFMEILADESLMPEAREYLAVKCLTKHPKNVRNVLCAVKALLFSDAAPKGERVTSFEQDAGLIRSAFRQVYGINLHTERLHWLEFMELLQNLPTGNRYEEVLSIRTREIPAPNKYNAKEREWLIRAKESVAIKLTEQEQAEKYERDVSNIFKGLLSMIPKEVNNTDGK